MTPRPKEELVTLVARGETVPAMGFRPAEPGTYPGITIGQEATGTNDFIRRAAADRADRGCKVMIVAYRF